MADTADRVAKAYDEKIDPNRLIPIGEAFNIISFGVSALKQTSDGIKNSFKDRLAQKEKINADKKIQSARLLNAKKQADKEKGLESKPKESKVPLAKNIKQKTGNIFQRVLAAASWIFVGWFLDKIPKLFEWIDGMVKKLKGFFEGAKKVWIAISTALVGVYDVAAKITKQFKGEDNIPKDSDKTIEEFKNLENDLKKTREDLDKNIEDTKAAIVKFANDRGDGDVPLHDTDEKAHSSAEKPDEGLDMSGHKQLHKNMEGELKNKLSADDPNGSKPKVEENKQVAPIVKKEVETVTKTITIKKAGTGGFDQKTGKFHINNKEVTSDEYMKFFNSSMRDKVKNYGVTKEITVNVKKGDSGDEKKKVITPQGLGMDMYSRKIILNPDAARGWTKVLKAAAEDGIDLTKAVTSSYRSPDKQREIIADPNSMTPAPVDKSPHVQGWAIDLAAGTTEWEWLKKNGSKYGWRWNTDPNDPVHFDFMGGNPDNKHWIEPGRNNWMQGNMKTGEKVASLKKDSNKTTVPIPINTITRMIPSPNPDTGDGGSEKVASGGNVLGMLSTINTLYT